MPPSLIPTLQVSIVHSFDQLTPDDITVEVRGNTLSSVPGADNIPQAMVAAINNAMPEILAEIFTWLFQHGIHQASWKTAKCILIPETGKKEKDQLNSYRPISILSYLRNSQEKVAARRIAQSAAATGAINDSGTGSHANRSVQDTLLHLLTPAQKWLAVSKTAFTIKKKIEPIRPSILANHMDGTFNTVRHQ